MSLEDSLKGANFDSKKWLEEQLNKFEKEQQQLIEKIDVRSGEEVNETSEDLQLTEILFNVKYLQQKWQDELLQAQESVHSSQDTILQKQEEAVESLCEVESFLENCEQVNKMIHTPLNTAVFNEIYEMIQVKSRLNYSMEVFETVITLDSYEQDIKSAIEEGNLSELTAKCAVISDTIAILLKLPKLHPNYEKAETILNSVLSYLKDLIHLAFLSDDKNVSTKMQQYYDILRILKQEQVFQEIAAEHKLSQKQKEDIAKIIHPK